MTVAAIEAKICGLRTHRSVRSAVAGGAAYIGFVFYEPSPRYVTPAAAAALAEAIPPSIKKVAVLGAGLMGTGIAAHLANAGIPSVLFDIVPNEATSPMHWVAAAPRAYMICCSFKP